LLGHFLEGGLGADAADLGVLLLLEGELERLHAGVEHGFENLVLLVALLQGGVGLDDALEGLEAELGVLAGFFEGGLGAGGDFCELDLLVVDFLLGGGIDIFDEEFGHVGVDGGEKESDEADAVYDAHDIEGEEFYEALDFDFEGCGIEGAGVEIKA
jgi:hypothetical protein